MPEKRSDKPNRQKGSINPRAEGRPAASAGSFEARFSQAIVQHGIAPTPTALLRYQGKLELTIQEVWFTAYVLSHKWDADLPYPSLKRMASAVGMSVRNVQRIRQQLETHNFLVVAERNTQQGGKDTNTYDFSPLFKALEEAISEDPPAPNDIEGEVFAPTPGRAANIDTSFMARYGRVLLSVGITTVPRALFTHQKVLGLTPQQVWFVLYIFSFQWRHPLPYPSLLKMAERTGYSIARIHEIKDELVAAGYLRVEHRQTSAKGQDTSAYDFSGLLEAIRQHLQKGEQGEAAAVEGENMESEEGAEEQLAQPIVPQRRGKAGARARARLGGQLGTTSSLLPVERLDKGGDKERIEADDAEQIGVDDIEQIEVGDAGRIEVDDAGRTGHIHPVTPTYMTIGGGGQVTPGGYEVESIQEEAFNKRTDSNQLSNAEKMQNVPRIDETTSAPRYSPYIAQVTTDFSDELGDSNHTIQNTSQALRLWSRTTLTDDEFVKLMYEAKNLTRKYQARPHTDAMQNKMAYFFTVLRDIVDRG